MLFVCFNVNEQIIVMKCNIEVKEDLLKLKNEN